MRVRFPLGAKILAWFFLNLVLLAALALIVAQQKMRFGLDSLVAGRAGDRVRAVATLALAEFRQTPRAQWSGILDNAGRTNGVEIFLFSERGTELAGRPIALPPEILRRMDESRSPIHPRPPPGAPPPPLETTRGPDVIGLVRAGDPPRYWVLLHAPLPQLREEGPAMLLMMADSLGAGGLIFDYRPLLWSAGAVVLVSVLFWLPLVRGITRSIGSMRAATARIAEGRFETALAIERQDELGALALSINRMSERIAGLLHGQRRFLGDVAHELCAPLSRLQLALGILEERAGDARSLVDLRDEVDQISALVNELLAFSRASLGETKLQLRAVELRPLLLEAAERENAPVSLECPENLRAQADRDLLLRALANLFRNAVRHAPGEIEVRAFARDGAIVIEVADHGPGIPPAILPQIFDPFVRVDHSRTRETGGVGLGLTIAKTCIESCGGSIQIENRAPAGVRVTVRLRAIA